VNKAVPVCIIIVPSLTPNGPIKGAIALANGLSELGVRVSFVALKTGPGANSLLLPDVALHELNYSSLFFLLQMRANILKILSQLRAGCNETAVVISMCFSADLVNVLLPSSIKKIVSVRSDLKDNYSLEYGPMGLILASIHHWMFRFIDVVVSMNSEMESVLSNFKCREIITIPNFINEVDFKKVETLASDFSGQKIIFVGSLTNRKKPLLLLETVISLNEKGSDLTLLFVGDGPLKDQMTRRISESGSNQIHIMGFQKSPSKFVRNCDIMVLPSLSEGTPRAVMEALYVGTPCVMRNLVTNDNLVVDGVNGYLFDKDEDLEVALVKALSLKKRAISTHGLLDQSFSQNTCSKSFLKIIERLSK
jgi:glycosyltransferase involved in cell wall biosynthesis